jgi:hypothetical protein
MGSTVRSVGRGPRCTQTERPARIETVRGRDPGGPLGTCPSGTSLFTNELAAPVVRCRQDEMGKGTPVGGRQLLLCARPAAADAGPRAVGSGRIPRSRNATLPCGGELALRRVGLWLGPEVGLLRSVHQRGRFSVDQGLELTPGSVYGPVSIPARSKTPGEKLSGMAVVIGVRLRAQAAPSDVMVWSTVGDLVAVSRLDFEDGGEHELTGVHRRWGLYRVARRHPVMPRNKCSTVAMNRGAGGVRWMAVDLRNKASTGSTCFSHLSLARSVVVMWRRGRRLQGTTQRRDQRVGEAA